MEIVYTEVAKMDLAKWKRINNKQILKKIEILILKIKLLQVPMKRFS